MKIIPIKVVHYSDLKTGDLVSDVIFLDGKLYVDACVLQFVKIHENYVCFNHYLGKDIYGFHKNKTGGFLIDFNCNHEWQLVKVIGDGNPDGEKEITNETQSPNGKEGEIRGSSINN